MSDNIFKLIEQYEFDFTNRPVEVLNGYKFDQLNTVIENQRYYAGKFQSGSVDEFGYKYFFNIGKSRVKNAVKNIDLDTKDVQFRAAKPADRYKAWLLRRDAAQWMRKRRLGKLFNLSAECVPRDGTFVLKKVGGEEIIRKVELKNLKNDPTANCLEESWVIEDHYYTPMELRKEVARGWDKDAIEKAIRSFRQNRKENYVDQINTENNAKGNAQYIHVKEFYGEVPMSMLDEQADDDSFVYAMFIIISPEGGTNSNQKNEEEKKGLILDKKKLTECRYKEVHYDKETGRWLGVGLMEDLRDLQILKNEEINLVVQSMRLANLILFQTGDEVVARNILTDLVNGDVLKVKAGVERINTQNLGLSSDNVLSQEIEKLANDLANSFEVTTGATLPSGTPFSLGALINQNANKLFDLIRENLGLFWQEVFEDWIMPQLEKDLNKEHLLELTSKEEIMWVQEKMQQHMMWDAIKNFVLKHKRKPTQKEVQFALQVLEQRAVKEESEFLQIQEGMYDFEKSVWVDLTGERENKGNKLQTLYSILQVIGGNPTMLDHPVVQEILDTTGYADVDFRQNAVSSVPQETIPQPAQQLTPA